MTKQEIESHIRGALAPDATVDVRVQPDISGRWRVVVISELFRDLPAVKRSDLALGGLDREEIEVAELLTPGEREWSGALITNSDLSDSPLWIDALARRSKTGEPILFASDIDSDLPLPYRVTFYSVRGGVGRSTALSYAARILASKGFRVVCVDFDLEAPGLASLFGVERDVKTGTGVVSLLNSYDRGETPDVSRHLLKVSESDELYCLPAGKVDADYIRSLQFIAPGAWYSEERNPLRQLIDGLSNQLPFRPDVLLFDSRTGISEISAPLLFDLCDLAILVFFPHPQVRSAMRELVRTLLVSKALRSNAGARITPEPRFLLSPIPASKSPEVANKYRSRAEEWIAEWLQDTGLNSEAIDSIIDSTQIIGYREHTAISDASLGNTEVWSDYAGIADWIEKSLPSPFESVAVENSSEKEEILAQLNFASGLAEQQEHFLETFVEVAATRRALDPNVPIVLGRKGVGKTAIFRRLLEKKDTHAVAVTAPTPLSHGFSWLLSSDGFAEADEILSNTGAEWRYLWRVLIVLACRYSSEDLPSIDRLGRIELPHALRGPSAVLDILQEVLCQPRVGTILSEALDKIEAQASSPFLLLFDGLDTGFGNSAKDRERRRAALQGLAELTLTRLGDKSMRFKLVLREDLWRGLRVENKSHFYGHTVMLEWKDQASYYKVVIKQALRSEAFERLVRRTLPLVNFENLNDWTEREVTSVWNVLVGERMKGGNTAKTANWVWNRLADANEDHSPRSLLQLFKEVLVFEQSEHRRSPFERTILRPRGLEVALPTVSNQALQALASEEFPELEPLMQKLRDIGRTPFSGDEVADFPEDLALAREVGLVGVYEGTEEKVERYRIPEIYRYALKMTRRGQA